MTAKMLSQTGEVAEWTNVPDSKSGVGANPPWVRSHPLRQDNAYLQAAQPFIKNLASKGVSVHMLADLAGHKSVAKTNQYIDRGTDLQRQAIELNAQN